MVIFTGANYTPVLLQTDVFQRWRHLFKSRHNGMCLKLGNADISHPVTLFLPERQRASYRVFSCNFFHSPNDPFDLSVVPLFFSLPKHYLLLVKSIDSSEKTGRHQQNISKLPRFALGTEGGLSHMSSDLCA